MVCGHLRELYELCEKNHLRLGGSDLIRIVCKQCDQEETCPSVFMDEYDAAAAARGDASLSDDSKADPDGSCQK